jgi:hypothetical protein
MKRAKAIDVSAGGAQREHDQNEIFLNRAQLAQRHRTTIETVKRRQGNGMYIAYKLGRTIRYKLSEIVAAENSGRLA